MPHLLQKKWGTVRAELEAMAKLTPYSNRCALGLHAKPLMPKCNT